MSHDNFELLLNRNSIGHEGLHLVFRQETDQLGRGVVTPRVDLRFSRNNQSFDFVEVDLIEQFIGIIIVKDSQNNPVIFLLFVRDLAVRLEAFERLSVAKPTLDRHIRRIVFNEGERPQSE